MRTYDLSKISPSQRAELLRRPVLKSSEMIAKVQPIVEEVRLKGDAALLDLTAKFDKVKLQVPSAPSSVSARVDGSERRCP
jgi:phosphoribosyl-ATP pyrophosphohydrolase/phosphoribosyl-AMP cyclohydrolase/histidinol dehydrogenase